MSLYGFIIGIAFAFGFELFSQKNKIIPKNKENLFFILLFVFSLIGARIYAVVSDWNYYSQDPIQILNYKAGGLGIFGGLILGFIFVYVFSQKYKLSFLKITDLLVPFVALGQSIGRWGNYFNTEVFGIPTYSNFGQYIPQTSRPFQFQNYSYFHPVWFYESILDFLLFIILFKSKKNQTAYYLIGYGLIRFFLEFLRWDTFTVNGLKIGQIISLISILTGIFLTSYSKNKVLK